METTHRPHPRYKHELVGLFLTLRHDDMQNNPQTPPSLQTRVGGVVSYLTTCRGMQIRPTDPTLATNMSRRGCFLSLQLTRQSVTDPPSLQMRVGGSFLDNSRRSADPWKRAQMTHLASFGPLVSSFLSFFHVLLILIIKFRLLLMFLTDGWLTDGRDDENGPKRRICRRLGHY